MSRLRMNDFISRKAEPKDVEAMVRIQHDAVVKAWAPHIQEDFASFMAQRFDHNTQVQKYGERVLDPDRILIVAEMKDSIVGFCGAKLHGPDEQPLGFQYQGNGFYLDPAYEGTGASLVMAEGLRQELMARNAVSICGWCIADNRGARNFYERRGGTLITDAIQPPEYGPTPHVCYGWVF